MRRPSEKLEQGRVRVGPWASHRMLGPNGMFNIQGPCGAELKIMASEGDKQIPWEHVSVSTARRPPNWQEMCFIKDLFWHDDVCVMQLHPPKANYVNFHPHTLHLWRPHKLEIPQPPSHLVGPKHEAAL